MGLAREHKRDIVLMVNDLATVWGGGNGQTSALYAAHVWPGAQPENVQKRGP